MGALAVNVVLRDPETDAVVCFGPDHDEVPQWALDQLGEHCFEGGKRPAKKAAPKSEPAK